MEVDKETKEREREERARVSLDFLNLFPFSDKEALPIFSPLPAFCFSFLK